jgi:hypothetical protein
MKKYVRVLTTSALILACGAMAAPAQVVMPQPSPQQSPEGPGMRPSMMGQGMMGGGGMMGSGLLGPPAMMRVIFTLMDSDGDGTISLQEFQAAHEQIFKAIDANKDGRVSLEEMQAFMQGTTRAAPPQ